jgi:hypothetical protein
MRPPSFVFLNHDPQHDRDGHNHGVKRVKRGEHESILSQSPRYFPPVASRLAVFLQRIALGAMA